jgi:hypothetical protein
MLPIPTFLSTALLFTPNHALSTNAIETILKCIELRKSWNENKVQATEGHKVPWLTLFKSTSAKLYMQKKLYDCIVTSSVTRYNQHRSKTDEKQQIIYTRVAYMMALVRACQKLAELAAAKLGTQSLVYDKHRSRKVVKVLESIK